MKNYRQTKIKDIILNKSIYNQQELQEALTADGVNATQPTISRDINELGLIKVRDEFGKYKYQLPKAKSKSVDSFFVDTVLSVDTAMNLVVLKCKPGSASGNCAMLDALNMNGVIGTIAGDDTIFIAANSIESATELKKEILTKLDIG